MEEIMTAITTVGFPIVMCLVEAWYIVSRADKTTEVLEQNTKALERISTIIDGGDDNE